MCLTMSLQEARTEGAPEEAEEWEVGFGSGNSS
jgi:hypothetical protein